MALSRRYPNNLGVSTELHGVPMTFKLATACALMALPLRESSCHGTHTALTTFCLHSEVVEITDRVLSSGMTNASDHASTVCLRQARLKPKGYYALGFSYVFVSEWYPERLHYPASTEPAWGCTSVTVKRIFICIHQFILFCLVSLLSWKRRWRRSGIA